MPFGGETAESYYDEGLTAVVKGDVTHAVECLRRAIQLDSSYAAAFHQLGKCYLRLGQPQQAIEILAQVTARKPNLVPARLDLGHALLQLGSSNEAQKQFAHVLALQPGNARAHLGMAYVNFQEGAWSNAVSLAQAARNLGGASFATLFLLGRAAKLAGNTVLAEESLKEAEGLIEKSVELSPDTPEGYYLRGEVCFARERFAPALEQYRAAEDRADAAKCYSTFGENFTRTDILVKRALCLQRLGSIEGARELAKQVLASNPEHKLAQSLANL